MELNRYSEGTYKTIYNSRNLIVLLNQDPDLLLIGIYNSRNLIVLLNKMRGLNFNLSTTVEI